MVSSDKRTIDNPSSARLRGGIFTLADALMTRRCVNEETGVKCVQNERGYRYGHAEYRQQKTAVDWCRHAARNLRARNAV